MKKQSIIMAVLLLLISTYSHADANVYLHIFEKQKTIDILFFEKVADCAIAGMEYKKKGYSFTCNIVKKHDGYY